MVTHCCLWWVLTLLTQVTAKWGTYRPGLYFGIQSDSPDTLPSGLMWFTPSSWTKMRHFCEDDDTIPFFGWLKHDGDSFGLQTIEDELNKVQLTTVFLKDGDNVHVRISGASLDSLGNNVKLSLFYYVSATGDSDLSYDSENHQVLGTVNGKLYRYHFHSMDGSEHIRAYAVPKDQMYRIKDLVQTEIQNYATEQMKIAQPTQDTVHHYLRLPNKIDPQANVIVLQKYVTAPFTFEYTLQPASDSPTQQSAITSKLKAAETLFDKKFEKTFSAVPKEATDLARFCVSNLVGGVGFFHGKQIFGGALPSAPQDDTIPEDDYFEEETVKETNTEPREEGPFTLLSAVPSRTFFPRGFFWDEGFHQLLISEWNLETSLDIVRSWFNLMDDDGWIPREIILGPEARSRVPKEFLTQYSLYANPPSFSIHLRKLLEMRMSRPELLKDEVVGKRNGTAETIDRYLKDMYPKYLKHYHWLRTTQKGDASGELQEHSESVFRWKGRKGIHILTSGLDDYPRSKVESETELHLDLLSWVIYYGETLQRVATFLGHTVDAKNLEGQVKNMKNALNGPHWSEEAQCFADLVTDTNGHLLRVVHKGYVTLFPFMLGLIDPASPKLKAILNILSDKDKVWSPYGIRSLSKSDSYYGTGENYWRGPIWMNMNYLILSSLYKYAQTPGPQQERCKHLYSALRQNLIQLILGEFKRTKYVWEQYDPETGQGKRSRPFTGWTSLIVLILAEKY